MPAHACPCLPMPNRWLALIFSFVCLLAPAHAADLPAHNREIKVDLKTPPAWDHVGWVTIKGKIYILYSGDLYDASGSPTNFKIDVTLTVKKDSNYEISKVGEEKVNPPAKSYKKKKKLDVSASSEKKLPYELIDGNEDKMAGEIIFVPVEVMVNNTKIEEDDLVVVSKGKDEDLATDYSIKVKGLDGLIADLSVKGKDDNIKFKDTSLSLKNNTEAKTKLWGKKPSSARDKTIILASLKHGSKAIGEVEEEVTVFKGVKIEFAGNYYINVDTRDFRRRPWDGRKDPKMPNTNSPKLIEANAKIWLKDLKTKKEKTDFKLAVDQSSSFGYQSAVSFKKGDNKAIPKYKPWMDPLSVKVKKVFAKKPSIDLASASILNQDIEMNQGVLAGKNGSEKLLDPVIKVGNFFTLEKTTSNNSISEEKKLPQKPITGADIEKQINNEKGKGLDELLSWILEAENNSIPKHMAFFSDLVFSWENDTFSINPNTKTFKSISFKALKASIESKNKIKVNWDFKKWNEFKFQGELDNAVIETK